MEGRELESSRGGDMAFGTVVNIAVVEWFGLFGFFSFFKVWGVLDGFFSWDFCPLLSSPLLNKP